MARRERYARRVWATVNGNPNEKVSVVGGDFDMFILRREWAKDEGPRYTYSVVVNGVEQDASYNAIGEAEADALAIRNAVRMAFQEGN